MQTTNSRREAALLVVAVFTLGLLLGIVGNHIWGERLWGVSADASALAQKHFDVQLTQDLQLTPEQQKQLHVIIEDTQAKWRGLYGPLEGQRTRIREESHDRMRAMLTPDQKPKFDAFMKRLDEQRKKNAALSPIPPPARQQ